MSHPATVFSAIETDVGAVGVALLSMIVLSRFTILLRPRCHPLSPHVGDCVGDCIRSMFQIMSWMEGAAHVRPTLEGGGAGAGAGASKQDVAFSNKIETVARRGLQHALKSSKGMLIVINQEVRVRARDRCETCAPAAFHVIASCSSRETPQGVIQYVSDGSRALLGYMPHQLIGRHNADYMTAEGLVSRSFETCRRSPSTTLVALQCTVSGVVVSHVDASYGTLYGTPHRHRRARSLRP